MNSQDNRSPGATRPAAEDKSGGMTKRTSADALLGPDGRLLIEHRGDCYVLRMTRQGRLILTK